MPRTIGGWNICFKCPHDLSPALNTCLNTALTSLTGAGYELILYVGSQLVSGTNYLVICKETTLTNPPSERLVAVVINQPLSGKCTIVSVKPLLA
ncbi:MAG: hypothetical protein ACRCXT_16670 [Paraclostridium sp.]